MIAKRLNQKSHNDLLLKSTFQEIYYFLTKQDYSRELNRLRPILRMKLDAVSLVVKYSRDYPHLLVTPDGDGTVYVANCLRSFDSKPALGQQIPEFQPESEYITSKPCKNLLRKNESS